MSNQEHLIRSIEDAFSSSGGYIRINKRALEAFGWHGALYISLMMEKSRLHAVRQGVDWFFYRNDDLLKDTQFGDQNRNKLNKLKKYFERAGVLESKIEGLPSKQWFRINPLRLSEFVEEEINSTGSDKNRTLQGDKNRTIQGDKNRMRGDNIEERDNEIECSYQNTTNFFQEEKIERSKKKKPSRRNAPIRIPARTTKSTVKKEPKRTPAFNPKKASASAKKKISAADEKYIAITRDLTELWNYAADHINSEFSPPKKLTQHKAEGKAFQKRVQLIKDAMNGNLQKRMSKNGWLKKLSEEERDQLMNTKLNETKLEWLITVKWRYFFNPDKNKSDFQPGKHPTTLNDFFLNRNKTCWALLLFNLNLNGNGNGRSQASQSSGDADVDLISENLENALTVDVNSKIEGHLNDNARRLRAWFEDCCHWGPSGGYRAEEMEASILKNLELPYPEVEGLYDQRLSEDGNTRRYFKELDKDPELRRKVSENTKAKVEATKGVEWHAIGWRHECKTVDLARDYAAFVKDVAEKNGYTVSPRAIDIGSKFFYMYIEKRLAPLLDGEQYPFPFDPEKVAQQVEEARRIPWEN